MTEVQGKLRFGLTEAGKVLLRGAGFVALAALIVPAFGVLSVLVSILVMALVVGFIVRPRIHVGGSLPEHVAAGQTARLTYRLTNIGRWPAYSLYLRFHALPEAIEAVDDMPVVGRLGPSETAEVTMSIRPRRRGRYQIGRPICESSFPFNLFHFGLAHDEQESLIVLPAFSLLQIPLRYASRHVNISNVRPAARIGVSPEYVGNRPFLPGDSPRRIDVRAWARLSVPATKEYDDDLDNYAALLLDTRVPPAWLKSKAKEIRELEAAVSLCASVAYTIHRDCLIDLLVIGKALHQFTGWPKGMRLTRVHELLACAEPSQGFQPEQVGPRLEDRFQEVSEAIFILLSWDRMHQQLVQLAERAGCDCTVIVVGGQQDSAELPARRPVPTGEIAEEPAFIAPDWDQGWAGDIHYVAPDEILTGRIAHL